MEKVFGAIKNFITERLPDYLEQVSDPSTPCPPPKERDIVFGSVDASRIQSRCVVVVSPDSQEEADEELGSWNERSNVTVTFILSGSPYDVLVRQMVRYPAAFRSAILDDPSLCGFAEDVAIGTRTFHLDCGTADRQMTACEVELAITTDEEIPV